MGKVSALPKFVEPNATDGVILLDKFLRIKKCSPQAETLLHYPHQSLTGKHISEVLPAHIYDAVQAGRPITTRMESASSTQLVMYEPVGVSDLAGVLVIRDVCQEIQLASGVESLQDSVHHFADGVKSLPVEVFVTDGQGKTLGVNGSCEQLYGVPAATLLGRNVQELESEGFFFPSLTPVVVQTKKAVTVVQETKTGRRIMASANPVFDRSGNIVLIVTTSRDITEFYQLKQQLTHMEETFKRYVTNLGRQPSKEENLVTTSPVMQRLMGSLERVASFDSTVLFLGESGTGKDTLARHLHKLSPRNAGPFVKVNCGAVPETLMESEFFGYMPGAFTGAHKCGKKGLVELADHGTLFLDEIDSLTLALQAKLLHVIQEREFQPVGGTSTVHVDVRFVAATNKDLATLVKEGRFREDLYYRLNVIPVQIPPLRDRREEVVPLARFFLERLSKRYGVDRRLDPAALDLLSRYRWPGNVRELENVIERCIVTSASPVISAPCVAECLQTRDHSGTITLMDTDVAPSLIEKMANAERGILEEALRKYGSTRKVAAFLGVNQSTVVRKMKRFGLSSFDREETASS